MPRSGEMRWISSSPNVASGSPGHSARAPESRSPRTTTAPTPMERSASVSRASIWPSRPRIASGSTRGIASRTANGARVTAWIGSSRVHPHVCRANDAGGITTVRVPAAFWLSHWPAATQSGETSDHVPVGSSRSDHAGATAVATTSDTATMPGVRTLEATQPTPSTSGRRTSGSNLCRLRSGARGPS